MNLTRQNVLEKTVNVALVLAAVLVVFLAYRAFVRPRLLSKNMIVAGSQADPKIGEFVTNAGQPLVGQKGGLVVVIRQGCIYCSESMPFYRELVKTHAPAGPPLIFLMPGSKEANVNYLKSNLGTEEDVQMFSQNSLHVSGTPTLVLLDSSSHIQKVWVGKLSPSQEIEVKTTVKMAS